jgi:hypothetical protein
MNFHRAICTVERPTTKNGRQPELPPVPMCSGERYCFIRIVVASLVTSSITDAEVRMP